MVSYTIEIINYYLVSLWHLKCDKGDIKETVSLIFFERGDFPGTMANTLGYIHGRT